MPTSKTNNDDQIVNAIQKRKRGSKSASLEATMTATNEEVKQAISNVLYWYNRPIVKSNAECASRLNEFFSHVAKTGEIPTVEKMCLALGTVRGVVWRWENGRDCDAERRDMIKKAKEMLAAIDAEMVSTGKIPQVTYIFRAKNYFGLKDQQDVIITPNNPLGDTQNAEDIAQKYAELPED